MFDPDWIASALSARPGRIVDTAEKRAAVALMLRHNPAPASADLSGMEVFVIRRARNERDPWSGHMAFPGGRLEPDDPDLAYTARRETLEETGLTINPDSLIGRVDDVQGRSRGRSIGLVISCFVYHVQHTAFETPTLNYEVDASWWVPLEWFADRQRQFRYSPPAPHTGEYAGVRITDDPADVVWGLTYRFMADFYDRLDLTLPTTVDDID